MLNIRRARNFPVVQRDFKSFDAQLNYQVILQTPSTENLLHGGNHATHFSASAAMSVDQVGSLCSVEAYEALERCAGNDPKVTSNFPSAAKKCPLVRRGRRCNSSLDQPQRRGQSTSMRPQGPVSGGDGPETQRRKWD